MTDDKLYFSNNNENKQGYWHTDDNGNDHYLGNPEIPLTESHLKLLDEHGWYVVQDELGNLSCKRKETYNDKFRRELEEEYDVMMDDLRKEQRRDRKWGLFFMCCLIGAFIFGLFLW